MPLTSPNFSAAQSIGLPSIITLTDTSVGSDLAIDKRRVYLQKGDASFLVPAGTVTAYIEWDYINSTITIDALDKDYSLSILVQFLDEANNVLYSKTIQYVFTLYAMTFFYSLTQVQTSNPRIVDDQVYYQNKIKLWCSIQEAINANDLGGDIYSAQAALDRANLMIQNENSFF